MTLRYGAAVLVLLSSAALADELKWSPPHQIRAVAVDRDSRPVAGVTVTVRAVGVDRVDRTLVELTDSRGAVAFRRVPRGRYVISFQLSGFADTAVGPIPVQDSISESPRIPELRVMLNPVLVW